MSNFNNRVNFALDLLVSTVIGLTCVLAFIGAAVIVMQKDVVRGIHNAAVCDETCSVMDLRNMQQESSCWCGDDDHSIRVVPFAWENADGSRSGRVITDTVEVKAER